MPEAFDDDFEEGEEDKDQSAEPQLTGSQAAAIRTAEARKWQKRLDRETTKAAEEAVAIYRQVQERYQSAHRLFEKAGYPGLTQDFLTFHKDDTAQVTEVTVDEFLGQRGLEPKPPSEARPTEPGLAAALANFHQGGSGGSVAAPKMSNDEFRTLYEQNPAAAVAEANRRGLQDPGPLGVLGP